MGVQRCLDDFEVPWDEDPLFGRSDVPVEDRWAKHRNVSPIWLLSEEYQVVDAALLILGLEPQSARSTIACTVDSHLPEGYQAILAALRAAIKSGKVSGLISPRYEEIYPTGCCEVPDSMDAHSSWVGKHSLIAWLDECGFTDCVFFKGSAQRSSFTNPSHPRYSAKLAAVVEAWESFDERTEEPGTVKQRLAKWLRLNAARFGLTNEDGKPSESVIEELAKVANWATVGGAPKQTTEEPCPF